MEGKEFAHAFPIPCPPISLKAVATVSISIRRRPINAHRSPPKPPLKVVSLERKLLILSLHGVERKRRQIHLMCTSSTTSSACVKSNFQALSKAQNILTSRLKCKTRIPQRRPDRRYEMSRTFSQSISCIHTIGFEFPRHTGHFHITVSISCFLLLSGTAR